MNLGNYYFDHPLSILVRPYYYLYMNCIISLNDPSLRRSNVTIIILGQHLWLNVRVPSVSWSHNYTSYLLNHSLRFLNVMRLSNEGPPIIHLGLIVDSYISYIFFYLLFGLELVLDLLSQYLVWNPNWIFMV